MEFPQKELVVYEYASVKTCRDETGKALIPIVWVDVNKGGADTPMVRSRSCVGETRARTSLDLGDPPRTFSATPPYEALGFLCSMCMARPVSRIGTTD